VIRNFKILKEGYQLIELYIPSSEIKKKKEDFIGREGNVEIVKDTSLGKSEKIIPTEYFQKRPIKQELIDVLVNNPEELLTKEGKMKDYSIFECHCVPQLARLKKADDKRKKFVEELIKLMKEKYPLPREEPIKICSIASGGCFQELVVHANLVKLGYKVDWCLGDPFYYKSENLETHPTIADFSKLIKSMSKETEIKVSYDFQAFFSEYKKLKRDIFLLIDSDLRGSLTEIELGKFWRKFPRKYDEYIRRHPNDFHKKDNTKVEISTLSKIDIVIRNLIPHERIYVFTYKKEGKASFYINYFKEKRPDIVSEEIKI
jgi:hypothetical protein